MNDVLHQVAIAASRYRIEEVAFDSFTTVREARVGDCLPCGANQGRHLGNSTPQAAIFAKDRPQQGAMPASDVDNFAEASEGVGFQESRDAHLADASHGIVEYRCFLTVLRLRDPVKEGLTINAIERSCTALYAFIELAVQGEV